MAADYLVSDLAAALAAVRLIDPHTHINPHAPAAMSLADLLGYHYYTELAHSVGVPQLHLGPSVDPREQVRTVLGALSLFANTMQAGWFAAVLPAAPWL